MSSNGYRLLGYGVWRAGKWYLRRRLPSTRKLALSGVVAVTGVGAAVVLARRLAA
jgi:hypothetical protein